MGHGFRGSGGRRRSRDGRGEERGGFNRRRRRRFPCIIRGDPERSSPKGPRPIEPAEIILCGECRRRIGLRGRASPWDWSFVAAEAIRDAVVVLDPAGEGQQVHGGSLRLRGHVLGPGQEREQRFRLVAAGRVFAAARARGLGRRTRRDQGLSADRLGLFTDGRGAGAPGEDGTNAAAFPGER